MKLKLTKIIACILIIFGATALIATPSYATDDPCSVLTGKAAEAAGCQGSSEAGLPKFVIGIINGVIAAAGLVAVIYVIIGGYHYMTSSGDPQKVQKAKSTILYALIGLAICVLSFAIVNWGIAAIEGNEKQANFSIEKSIAFLEK